MNALAIVKHYVPLIDSEQEVYVLATKSLECETLRDYIQSKNIGSKVFVYGVYKTGIVCFIDGKISRVRVSGSTKSKENPYDDNGGINDMLIKRNTK